MWGLFGWLPSPHFQQHDAYAVALEQFEALHHRGPDDKGFCIFPSDDTLSPLTEQNTPPKQKTPFHLLPGHTRLSIIDLSSAGHQPMTTKDGRYTLVYNGEIYNYLELRDELKAEGAQFYTETDTEVVLHSLIQWKEKALPRFIGMFAFAFYDRQTHRLFCARDAFGIKPFFWTRINGFSFASELPALLHFPGTPREPGNIP